MSVWGLNFKWIHMNIHLRFKVHFHSYSEAVFLLMLMYAMAQTTFLYTCTEDDTALGKIIIMMNLFHIKTFFFAIEHKHHWRFFFFNFYFLCHHIMCTCLFIYPFSTFFFKQFSHRLKAQLWTVNYSFAYSTIFDERV